MPLRIAIATKIYPDPTQTPVIQHIGNLFGGNTAVVCRERHPVLAGDRPSVCLAEHPLGAVDKLASPLEHIGNYIRHHNTHPPTGAKRRAVEDFLRAQGVERVLAEFGTEAGFIYPIARRLGLPVFVYFRGHDATAYLDSGKKGARRVRSYRAMMDGIDGVIAVSQFLLDRLAAKGITHPNSHVVPSGVDMTKFHPGPKTAGLVLAAGRFIHKKAPETTIRAFVGAARGHPGARLEMIGDGPLLGRCQALVEELGASSQVILHGRKSHEFVQDRLRAAPLFVQHSVVGPNGDQEGAPTVIQEAMAAGACVVSTRHAGIPYLIDEGATGFMVDEHDAIGFEARIGQMLENPEQCGAMGQAGRGKALREFDREMLYRRAEAVIAGRAPDRAEPPRRGQL
ncbi:glycosyltransferase [Brevirhabdus sp.]|uniref:glycosyltransferase n=1 Tax=Brevirhabdus sp. TaxID=2004514 RepID=UPI004057E9E3